jgi:hypothetical protein
LEDKLLEALELAGDIWEKSALGDKMEKLGYAAQLNRFGVFSLPQIAKVVRINSRFLYEEMKPKADKGGRFDPQTLSTLVRIRRCRLERKVVPHALIRTGIEGGTSYSCMVKLTGIPYSKYYEVARLVSHRAHDIPALVAGVQRDEIFKLRERGLTQQEIATATGVDQGTISRVLKGTH